MLRNLVVGEGLAELKLEPIEGFVSLAGGFVKAEEEEDANEEEDVDEGHFLVSVDLLVSPENDDPVWSVGRL